MFFDCLFDFFNDWSSDNSARIRRAIRQKLIKEDIKNGILTKEKLKEIKIKTKQHFEKIGEKDVSI